MHKAKFRFDEKYLKRHELLRVTLELVLKNNLPVIIYGVWLEAGV